MLATARTLRAEIHWPNWGGPGGTSHTEETGLPLTWTDDDVVWKTALKGFGQSTPVVWGDQLFLTTALDGGRQRVVFAVDRRDGRVLWEQTAWTGEPEQSHVMNGWASATCATNGKVVVAFFGRGGLHAYSLDGKHLWSRDLGKFDGPWGTAASPIFYGDTVIQNCDSESNEASLLAVDYRTGETVWSTPRENMRGWSTPIVIKTPQREELILNSHHGVRGYDPKTGRDLWWCEGFNGRGEPVPAYRPRPAVRRQRPGRRHLLGATRRRRRRHGHASRLAHAAQGRPRSALAGGDRQVPAGVQHAGHLVLLRLRKRQGVVERAHRTQNTPPRRWWPKAGPTSKAKRAIPSWSSPGEKLNVVGKSKLTSESDELFRASLVPSQGQIFIRSTKYLYAIGNSAAKK